MLKLFLSQNNYELLLAFPRENHCSAYRIGEFRFSYLGKLPFRIITKSRSFIFSQIEDDVMNG